MIGDWTPPTASQTTRRHSRRRPPSDNSDHQGEAVLFEGEEKQKILTKAQVDKALEVLKSKLKDLTEKAEKEKEKAEGKKEGEGEGGGLVRRALVAA